MKGYNDLRKEELQEILDKLIERHGYLGGEIEELTKDLAVKHLELKNLKQEWRDVVKKYKHQGFIFYREMMNLENELLPLVENNFTALIEYKEWIKVIDYAIFVWQESYKINGDDDGTVMALVHTTEASLKAFIEEAEKNSSLSKKVFSKFLKAAQNSVALSWDSHFWLEKAIKLLKSEEEAKKLKKIIQLIEKQKHQGTFDDIYLLLKIKMSVSTEEEKDELALENKIYFARRVKELRDSENFLALETLLLNKRNKSRRATGIDEELIHLYEKMGRISEALEIYKKQILKGQLQQDFKHIQSLVIETEDESYWTSLSNELKNKVDMEQFGKFLIDSGQRLLLVEEFDNMRDEELRENWALQFFHELSSEQQRELSSSLFEKFAEGLEKASDPKMYEALARGVLEIARSTNQRNKMITTFEKWQDDHPRKSTLPYILSDMVAKFSSTRLKKVNIKDKYRYGTGQRYLE